MAKKGTNLSDTMAGLLIGIPLFIMVMILASPFILYVIMIREPFRSLKRRRFLKRNIGKVILCISPGRKYKRFSSTHLTELISIGIHDIVVFDPVKSSNHYDGFEWGEMILSNLGFPILLHFTEEQINQQSLKNEFADFFKEEIDSNQLKTFIKEKIDAARSMKVN